MTAAPQWNDRVRRRVKLRDVDILLTVIQTGSMGKAANALNMSQPAVSKAIADLEHTLGVRLLDRSRQGVEPTPYGRALMKRGVAIFDELRQGVQDISFLTDPTAGEVRAGGSETMVSAVFSPVVRRLLGQHPRMTFLIDIGDFRVLSRELDARRIDVVISRLYGPPSRSIRSKFSSRIRWSSLPDRTIRWPAVAGSSCPSCWTNPGRCSRPTTLLDQSRWTPFALPGSLFRGSTSPPHPQLCATNCSQPAATSRCFHAFRSCCRAGMPRSGSCRWHYLTRDTRLRS
jgi:DNA-binding transcriptional LysR family regulator